MPQFLLGIPAGICARGSIDRNKLSGNGVLFCLRRCRFSSRVKLYPAQTGFAEEAVQVPSKFKYVSLAEFAFRSGRDRL